MRNSKTSVMLALWCWQPEGHILAHFSEICLVLAQCVHVRRSALTKRPMPRAALVAAAGTASTSTRTHAVRHTTASHGPPPPTRRKPALFLLPSTSLGLRLRFGLCRRSRKLRHTFLRLCGESPFCSQPSQDCGCPAAGGRAGRGCACSGTTAILAGL